MYQKVNDAQGDSNSYPVGTTGPRVVLATGIALICVLTTAAHLRVVMTSTCAISLTQSLTAVLCLGHVALTGLDYQT
jgi:hypothetical protein